MFENDEPIDVTKMYRAASQVEVKEQLFNIVENQF